MIAKNKQIFKDTLSGKEIAKDIFETPMVEGEIILYSGRYNGSDQMMIAKIIKVKRPSSKNSRHDSFGQLIWREPHQKIKLRVRRCIKNCSGWHIMKNNSNISKIDNVIVLTNPKPEILRLFKDIK